jgi:hypothetical protein
MDVTVRPATLDDYEAICEVLDEVDALHREALPHIFRKPDGPVREREDILAQVTGGDNLGLFVAEASGQVVGVLQVGTRAYLSSSISDAGCSPASRRRRRRLMTPARLSWSCTAVARPIGVRPTTGEVRYFGREHSDGATGREVLASSVPAGAATR